MFENSARKRLMLKGKHKISKRVYNLIKNKKILDLGCGGGWLASIFKPEYYTGISYSQIEVDSLRKKGYKAINIRLPSRLPFTENNFDAIYASHVLEHFEKNDIEKIMIEIKRVLKPRGILILITPTDYNPFFYAEWTQVRPYNHGSLPNLLNDFEFDKVDWFYPKISFLPKLLQRWLRFPLFFLKLIIWKEIVAYGYNKK